MSQSDIDKLHGHLAELESETKRQQGGAKEIHKATVAMLAAVEKRLGEIHGLTDKEEYQHLLQEKGVLQQVLGQSSR